MKQLLIFAAGGLAAFVMACSGSGGTSVHCTFDSDCPLGQQCVGGNCQLPSDPGPKLCTTSIDCPVGYECQQGFCVPIQPEEPGDGQDGSGFDGDGGTDDGGAGDDGQAVTDQDTRDFSAYVFIVAVSAGLPTGGAVQCVGNVQPAANSGPSLGEVPIKPGLRLSGLVTDKGAPLGKARVKLGGDAACLPAAIETDSQGGYGFQLPAGTYRIEVQAPDGRVTQDQVNLQGATTRSITFPTTADVGGGPLEYEGGAVASGWKVSAYFATGAYTGQLAHAGVVSNASGIFSLPLATGFLYDLYGEPPAGQSFPRQVLYSNVDSSTNILDHRVKTGTVLSGAVSLSGAGVAALTVQILGVTDPILFASATSATGGAYQTIIDNARRWWIDVVPNDSAFDQGALRFVSPGKFISADTVLDIELGGGQRETFRGRLLDNAGAPLSGVSVRLFFQSTPDSERLYPYCQPKGVTTGAGGEFSIGCNLAP